MLNPVLQLRQLGFSELACQLAAFIERLDHSHNPLIAFTAGLLSETVSQGHVCLNLAAQTTDANELAEYIPATVEKWQSALLESNVVGKSGEFTPLILTEQGQLYLYRYWQDEVDVAAEIKRRSHVQTDYDAAQLSNSFVSWHHDMTDTDWQKVAVLSALTQGLTIISGGPGTGKTTIVKTILRFSQQQDAQHRIALAAPTGKAAARLQQSVQTELTGTEAKTLHRLLGITPDNEQGRYSEQRPLPVDLLIVDEASMIDISLMAKLLKALPAQARLVLLGDSQQLASVESGAVLANLCEYPVSFTTDFVNVANRCGIHGLTAETSDNVLSNQLIQLQKSYRFAEHSLIGQLAKQVNNGKVDEVFNLIDSAEPAMRFAPDEGQVLKQLQTGYQPFMEAIERQLPATTVITAFESYRVLAALKQGPQSVESVNSLMQRYLIKRGWKTQHDFYHGRPIMITHNDYRQQLFNGDIGVVLKDETGQLKACFCFDDTLRWVDLNKLPAHETAFAMTVHKSQGSEFDHVAVLLPDMMTSVLNRELLYTALTRAKVGVSLLATTLVLQQTIQSQHQRESGLSAQLQNIKKPA